MSKEHYIKLFRENGYNCFPIPRYPDGHDNPKAGDYRYNGVQTRLNQDILETENYGIIPIKEAGTCILDLDDKERYRKFAEENIKNGYMVIETGNGWQIPVKGLLGKIDKVELFDHEIQDTKIVEIQGHNHYCMGAGSVIFHNKLQKTVIYENRGTDEIWNAKGMDFNNFVDKLCKSLCLEGKKRSRQYHYALRQKFLRGEIPSRNTSNDYFFNAPLQCNNDGLTKEEAIQKIEPIFRKWENSKDYSGRSWENILQKIDDVYDNDMKLVEGRPSTNKIDRIKIVEELLAKGNIYSDPETDDIFENKNGYLKRINNTLKKELNLLKLQKCDYDDILFKLVSIAPNLPETNKDLVYFKNGKRSFTTKELVNNEDIARISFPEFDYLPPTKENEPTEFLKLFDHIPKHEHGRLKEGLRNILRPHLDSKMSVIIGKSRMGKSTPFEILGLVMPQYVLFSSWDSLINDRFIRAKMEDRLLLVIQELPHSVNDWNYLKKLLGETILGERGFHQDYAKFDNMVKVFCTANTLPKIPKHEQNPMYDGRLSLIHNENKTQFKEDSTYFEKVAKDEGEKIISWLFNLEENQYEDGKTVKEEWEKLASPEIDYIKDNYALTKYSDVSIMDIKENFEQKTNCEIGLYTLRKALLDQGYIIKNNIIVNITKKTIEHF